MKKVIYGVIFLFLVGLMAFQLFSNKQDMEEKATLAARTVEAIPVTLGKVQLESVDRSFAANGTFQAYQDLSLMSETSGKVVKRFKLKGEKVKMGEMLAQVDDDLFQASLMTARANFEKSKKDLARFESLAGGEAITPRQLEEAKLGFENAKANLIVAQKQYDNAKITSPINGSINEDYIEIGSFVSPGYKLYEIVNVEKLKLVLKVSEADILHVKEGMSVGVKANVYPQKHFTGTVTAIGVKADNTLKYDVEVLVSNPDNILKAGMYGSAYFEVKDTDKALLIERKAIATSLQVPKVYTVKDQKAYLKEIVIGNTFGEWVEVLQGLEVGEEIVTTGQINLKEGTKVSIL